MTTQRRNNCLWGGFHIPRSKDPLGTWGLEVLVLELPRTNMADPSRDGAANHGKRRGEILP